MKTEKFLNLEKRTILCEIMDKHGSDKGNSHNYTKYYHELFKDKRLDTLNFFELGLGTNNTNFNFNMGDKGVPGASVYGWDEYFINGKIFGADIDKEILFDTERIKTFYCDQTNSLSIKDMWNNIPEYFDIIIEDGLHTFDANINFFENSYHKINPENGIFIIEDIMNNKIADWLNKIKEYEIKFPQFDFEIIRLNCENPNITDNNLIKITPKKIKKDIIAIISYCDTEEKINVLIDNINLIRNKYSNFEIVIQANYPLPENVQKIVDYYFYMDLNKSSYSPIIVWRTLPFFTKKFIYSCDEDHGYSVCQMINHIAKYFIQYDKVLLMNYDAVLEDEHFYNHSKLDSELLIYSWDEKGCSLILMSFNPASFYNKVSKFFTHESYLNLKNMTPEEKFFQFIKESNINYIKSNIFIKDKITGMPYLAAKNDFFKENLTCFNDNKLEIFLWHTNKKINKIKVNIDNVEYTLSNQNFKGAFENDSLIKYDNISKIDITSINDIEVNIPLKIIKNAKTEDTIKKQEKMLISIIMQGKNDTYLENFLQRLTFSISKHIDNIKTLWLENKVQIVLTDWGSEVKLIDVLDVDFSFIKYIYVKPEIAAKYNGDAKYSYVHPLNVSARNSDGEFIVWGDSDGFLPLESFEKLYHLILEMKKNNQYDTFYQGSRYHILRENYKNAKNIKEIDDFLKNTQIEFKHDQIDCDNFGGGAAISLLTKDMYFETTGIWEKLIHWGWQDIEFHRRLLKKYKFGGDLEKLGVKIYHLEHWENRVQGLSHFKWNEEIDSNVFQANENWGLKNEELEIIENKEKNMKLKLIHILNRLDGERETNSINSLSPLKNLGVDYIQQVTPLYEGDGWKTKPITNIPGNNNHGKGHYGNYLSFMKAIKENFTEDLDALILCECDCVLSLPLDEFLNEMKKTLDFSKKHHIYHFSWGGRIVNGIENGDILKIDNEYPNYCVVGKIILAHFIILTKESREFFLRKVDSMGWDVADIWLNEAIFSAESDGLFSGPGRQANVLNSLAYQYEGISDIDGIIKGKKSTISSDSTDVITHNFNNKAGFVEILGDANKTYNVHFLLDNKLVYESKIKSNNWAAASSEVNHIKIFNENNLLIFEKLKEKNVIEHFYNNIGGWFDFQPVYTSMVEKFGDNSLFVEIGAWLGKSTAYMAVEIANSKKNIKFDVIDTWEGSTGSDDTEWYNEIISVLDMSPYQTFLENTRPVKKYIRPIMGYSYDIVSDYTDNSIDFLFIDGAHDYDSVKKDIHDWYPKIKFNGMIGGHDYGNDTFPGLIKAVNEFFGQENVTHIKPSAWLVDKEKFENSKK